jgi:hypothetical protein
MKSEPVQMKLQVEEEKNLMQQLQGSIEKELEPNLD